MGCGCGQPAVTQGMAVTSGDLVADDRFKVTTDGGEVRAFTTYAEAKEFQATYGGKLRAL